ncbi:DUF2637 domain-containing protein [Streptomyces sp. AJS327]|uniref:DUF2637 domain-containing protein n=1 Tax=Streptomyces sp. AJS327 TaxID=2545265 RepID=UPI0015E01C62|nr:DUF2637 domain-containing protein [Streptomyces sp. AJS327]MBA0053868.1 DUF2637 domain-containing protein [Streptomyces sp. AJS327]
MQAVQLTRTHRILAAVVVAGAVVIAAIGFAGSFTAVRDLAEKKGFGAFAPFFPIGIDAGIVVLLALDLLLTWIRIPFPLLRQTAWLLTAATIAFNGAAAWPDKLGVGMHAVIPLLFVVTVEAARHAVGRVADITADRHMEGVRLSRWLLAFPSTFRLWRRMKLWELRSYDEVIRMEQDRLVYEARLRARYGRSWRRKAPVESLMPLKLARYGIPLSETGASGLAAAGISLPSGDRITRAEGEAPTTAPTGGGLERGRDAARPQLDAAARPGDALAHPETAHPGDAPQPHPERWERSHPSEAATTATPPPDTGHPHAGTAAVPEAAPYETAPHGVEAARAGTDAIPRSAEPQHPDTAPSLTPTNAHPAASATAPTGPPADETAFTTHTGHPAHTLQAPSGYPDVKVPEAGTTDAPPAHAASYAAGSARPGPQVTVPVSPGRRRTLGTAGGGGPAAAREQRAQEQQELFVEPTPDDAWAEDRATAPADGDERPPEVSAPAPRTEPAPRPTPEPVSEPVSEPVGIPNGMAPEEQYFRAYRQFVAAHSEFPNARQLSRTLHETYGVTNADGNLLSEGYLRGYMREFKARYNTEMGLAG